MVLVLLCIALTNLGLGFYLGTLLLTPFHTNVSVHATTAILEAEIPLPREHDDYRDLQAKDHNSHDSLVIEATVKPVASISSSKCWDAACTDIRQDISTLYDRTRYALSANDKLLARMITGEVQARIPLWQKLLQDKLAAMIAELERDPAAKVDCGTHELCLAQTETLQTNLVLLDWSDSTDSILKKLEREIEAVKHLLPAKR